MPSRKPAKGKAKVKITASSSGVKVDSANVIKTDIACKNGVIHVIDAVILPNTKDIWFLKDPHNPRSEWKRIKFDED